jgi:hypothetical protein
MSGRLTNQWTKSTVEAFGNTPQVNKGILAEQIYHKYALQVYPEVQYFPEDREMQIKGIDFIIKKSNWRRGYGVDVKGNMNSKGTFAVENDLLGWLRHPSKTNDRVCHICVEPEGVKRYNGYQYYIYNAVEYDRLQMAYFLNNRGDDMVYLNLETSGIDEIARGFKIYA